MTETIISRKEEGIGFITLNRPERYNALSELMIQEILSTLESMAKDEEVKTLIITGAGEKAFCAGADLAQAAERGILGEKEFLAAAVALTNAIEDFPKPVIAAVNGYALGGGLELAISCDMIAASENATFGFPEINLAVYPAAGGTQRLPRLIGKLKAKELIYTGERIPAKEAEKIGLVNRVVPKEELMKAAIEFAKKFLKKSPLALRQTKAVVNKGSGMTFEAGMAYADEAITILLASEDRKEGMKAFLEKREPKFKGK